MPEVTIANIDLSTPRVVVAVDDTVDIRALQQALQAGADIVEVRIDKFSDTTTEVVCEKLQAFQGMPVLATIRYATEEGEWQGNEAERLALFQAILPHVDAIDIEINATEIRDAVIAAAKTAGKTVIASFHNFKATPSLEDLQATAQAGRDAGADIIKVAVFCDTPSDLHTLAQFTLDANDAPVVSIGMGPAGAVSRIFFPALGSCLTYTFLGVPTAPGQLNCDETIGYLNTFYPKR